MAEPHKRRIARRFIALFAGSVFLVAGYAVSYPFGYFVLFYVGPFDLKTATNVTLLYGLLESYMDSGLPGSNVYSRYCDWCIGAIDDQFWDG